MMRQRPELSRFHDAHRIEQAFAAADAKLEKLTASLWRYIRVEKVGNRLRPAFDPAVNKTSADIATANAELDRIEKDAADFTKIMDEYSRISGMQADKTAAQIAIATAEDAVKDAANKAIKSGVPIDKLSHSNVVKEAEAHRDKTISELSAEVADLTDRIAKSNAILERYS